MIPLLTRATISSTMMSAERTAGSSAAKAANRRVSLVLFIEALSKPGLPELVPSRRLFSLHFTPEWAPEQRGLGTARGDKDRQAKAKPRGSAPAPSRRYALAW